MVCFICLSVFASVTLAVADGGNVVKGALDLLQDADAEGAQGAAVVAKASENLWKDVATSVADSSVWKAYGSNEVIDEGEYTKILVNDDDRGAYLYLRNIADSLRYVDNKNYKITFLAYVINGNDENMVIVRNESFPGIDKFYLTAFRDEYTSKRANSRSERMLIKFVDLPVGSTVYIGKDIKIQKMVDREYVHPFDKPFKGGTLDMNRPRSILDIEKWFSDFNDAGAKYIRIQANPKFGMNGFDKSGYLEDIVNRFNMNYLPLIKKYNMKVLFSMESIPYDDPALNNRKNPGFWENPETEQNFRDTARYIADSFKNVPEIFALQFMSEPMDENFRQPVSWNRISLDVIRIVRQYTDKFIAWSPGPGGLAKYESVVPFDDNRIIYNFHEFKPLSYTHQGVKPQFPLPVSYHGPEYMMEDIGVMVRFRNRNNNVPIMCGSYTLANWISDGSEWFGDLMVLLEDNGFSSFNFATGQYRAWDWRYIGVIDGSNAPVYTYDKSDNNMLWSLLSDYWKAKPKTNFIFANGFEY